MLLSHVFVDFNICHIPCLHCTQSLVVLANSPPSLVMTHISQNSAHVSSVPLSSIVDFIPVASISVSFVLTCPHPHLSRRAPVVVHE